MTVLLIVEPMLPIAITSSRGIFVANLLSPDPKEVWVDGASGSATVISVDLGTARQIDTIFLGYLRQAVAGATWTITGGVNGYNEFTIQPATSLRVPDTANEFASVSHALWYGGARIARYVAISVLQPGGSLQLLAGSLIVGRAFAPTLGQEWGFGRRPIDTGTTTPLPSGGFAIVQGARKRAIKWTFGDLDSDETDRLEQIAMARGSTSPLLVVEDADRTTGLRARIHYGLFEKWQEFERRNRRQTRWELELTEWV